MPKVGRIGDAFSCGDHVAAGSPNVYVNGLPVTRLGDATTGHGCYSANQLVQGNKSKVFANGIPISHIGNSNATHCCGDSCHSGTLSICSTNVFVGE